MRNNSVDQAVDYRDGMAKVYRMLLLFSSTLPCS